MLHRKYAIPGPFEQALLFYAFLPRKSGAMAAATLAALETTRATVRNSVTSLASNHPNWAASPPLLVIWLLVSGLCYFGVSLLRCWT